MNCRKILFACELSHRNVKVLMEKLFCLRWYGKIGVENLRISFCCSYGSVCLGLIEERQRWNLTSSKNPFLRFIDKDGAENEENYSKLFQNDTQVHLLTD